MIIVVLPACAARGVISLVPSAVVAGAAQQDVFIATNRLPAAEGQPRLFQQGFGERRDPALRFAKLDISIPPVHQPGQIEWPGSERPDPAKHFVVRQEHKYPGMDQFVQALADANGRDEVVLFVHGFNVNNAEAAYRLAQIAHDFESSLPVIAYSWPSAGSPRGYVYDRDSVIFSRDGLEELLLTLTARKKVLVIAHSMGSQLVMETLRQMSISGKGAALDRLSGVALISPDIDDDVFLQQAERITPFPQPFMLLVSAKDRILDFSAFLTGKPTRLGSIRDLDALDGLPIDIVDLSNIEGGDRTGHSTAFTAPAAIKLLRNLDRTAR